MKGFPERKWKRTKRKEKKRREKACLDEFGV
jgi:hypothetical protein